MRTPVTILDRYARRLRDLPPARAEIETPLWVPVPLERVRKGANFLPILQAMETNPELWADFPVVAREDGKVYAARWVLDAESTLPSLPYVEELPAVLRAYLECLQGVHKPSRSRTVWDLVATRMGWTGPPASQLLTLDVSSVTSHDTRHPGTVAAWGAGRVTFHNASRWANMAFARVCPRIFVPLGDLWRAMGDPEVLGRTLLDLEAGGWGGWGKRNRPM